VSLALHAVINEGIPTPHYIPGLASSNGVSRDGLKYVLLLHFHFLGTSPKLDKKIFWHLQETEYF
jgi:hypothetical protein